MNCHKNKIMKRRTFIKNSLLTTGILGSAGTVIGQNILLDAVSEEDAKVEVIKITSGSKQHWAGYYDKLLVNPSGRYALAGEVEAFFRSPTINDVLNVGIIDLENGCEWKKIGESRSWGWQQGCMMQWIPGSKSDVIWNDLGEKGWVSHIYNVKTGKTLTLPNPVYTLSSDGKFAISLDFERVQRFRPGYGYPVKKTRENWVKAPDDQGIYKVDLKTGKSKLLITNKQTVSLPRERGSVANDYHWFNHLLISPDCERFFFLDRSRPKLEGNGFFTRAMTADIDGGNIYRLNDEGSFSHFIWKGNDAIAAWAAPDEGGSRGFYVFPDKTHDCNQIGKDIMVTNGHITYVPHTNYEWILNDTYPQGEERLQELYLFHVPTSRKITLGKFHEPKEFRGEWRCDLHPRCDQQGKRVFFDSTHEGGKRQVYMVDISGIIGH